MDTRVMDMIEMINSRSCELRDMNYQVVAVATIVTNDTRNVCHGYKLEELIVKVILNRIEKPNTILYKSGLVNGAETLEDIMPVGYLVWLKVYTNMWQQICSCINRCDGFTSTFPDKLFKGYDMDIHNQIFYTTLCSCMISFTGLILQGNLFLAMDFVSQHNDCFIDIIILSTVSREIRSFLFTSTLERMKVVT